MNSNEKNSKVQNFMDIVVIVTITAIVISAFAVAQYKVMQLKEKSATHRIGR